MPIEFTEFRPYGYSFAPRINQDSVTGRYSLGFKPNDGDQARVVTWTDETDVKMTILTGAFGAFTSTTTGETLVIADPAGYLREYRLSDYFRTTSIPFLGANGLLITLHDGTVVFCANDSAFLHFTMRKTSGEWNAQKFALDPLLVIHPITFSFCQGPDELIYVFISADGYENMPLIRFSEQNGVLTQVDYVVDFVSALTINAAYRDGLMARAGEFPTPIAVPDNFNNRVILSYQHGPQENIPCSYAGAHFAIVAVPSITANIWQNKSLIVESPNLCERVYPGCAVFPTASGVYIFEPKYLPDCSRIGNRQFFDYGSSTLGASSLFNFLPNAFHENGWVVHGNILDRIVPLPPPANVGPVVSITQPVTGTISVAGTSILFVGLGLDAEDGNLNAALGWNSSLEGPIGTGGSFSTNALSVGTHLITASVVDSGGLVGSDAVTIGIVSPPPVLTILSVVNDIIFSAKRKMIVYVAVTATGLPVSGVAVQIAYRNPNGTTTVHFSTTGVNGKASTQFQLNKSGGVGEAQIISTASKTGYQTGVSAPVYVTIR